MRLFFSSSFGVFILPPRLFHPRYPPAASLLRWFDEIKPDFCIFVVLQPCKALSDKIYWNIRLLSAESFMNWSTLIPPPLTEFCKMLDIMNLNTISRTWRRKWRNFYLSSMSDCICLCCCQIKNKIEARHLKIQNTAVSFLKYFFVEKPL